MMMIPNKGTWNIHWEFECKKSSPKTQTRPDKTLKLEWYKVIKESSEPVVGRQDEEGHFLNLEMPVLQSNACNRRLYCFRLITKLALSSFHGQQQVWQTWGRGPHHLQVFIQCRKEVSRDWTGKIYKTWVVLHKNVCGRRGGHNWDKNTRDWRVEVFWFHLSRVQKRQNAEKMS